MSDLNDFLQELRQEGEKESEGAFTVPLEVAQDKLERFQLLDPAFYTVQLVASACASGSSFVHVNTGLTTVEFLSDGQAPNREQLDSLTSYLFENVGAPRFISELAVGLQGALNLPCKRVLVETFTEEGAWQLEMRQKSKRIRALNLVSPIVPLTRVVVDKGFGLTMPIRNRHQELMHLQQCRFAPLELRVDEERVYEQVTPPTDCVAWTRLRCPGLPEVTAADAPTTSSDHEDISGYLALSPVDWEFQMLQLVSDGVTFTRPNSRIGIPNLVGVVRLKGMRKNISFTDLVENSHFDGVMKTLREEALRLLVTVLREPEDTRPYWSQLLSVVKLVLRKQELADDTRRVLEQWTSFVSFALGGSRDFRATIAHARELLEMGQSEAAARLREEVLQKLKEALLGNLQLGLQQKSIELLDLLAEVAEEMEHPQLSECLQAREMAELLIDVTRPDLELFTEGWGIHRKGLMLRYLGQNVEAADTHASVNQSPNTELVGWAFRFCAELELRLGQYEQADRLLERSRELLPGQRDLAEEHAFLKRFLSVTQRQESVRLLNSALPEPESDPQVRWMFLDWLAREGRGFLPLDEWVRIRAQASFEELKMKLSQGVYREVEERLSDSFELLGWKSLAEARNERVEAARMCEERFGPNHPYTQFVRRRAVYQLHRLEAHPMADHLQCRGHLLAQYQRCLEAVQ